MHRLILALVTFVWFSGNASGQFPAVEARAGSVTGKVMVSSGTSRFALTPGYVLIPGSIVDTRAGGRAVIDLSDGSIVVVEPGSVITIKDIQAAASLRELFEITVGKVRVKINHFLGRPNPYRINSPTASIAVRGTDFTIEVDAGGDTRVVVFEGVVEVASLAHPNHKVLVEAGRGILVHPGQDLRLVVPEAAADAGERGRVAEAGSGRQEEREHGASKGTTQVAQREIDENSPRALASTYERYISSLTEIGQLPFLTRFNAFPERHLDSLENPAYATSFATGEARFFVLPSFHGSQGLGDNSGSFVAGRTQPLDYGIAPQVSLFTPLKDSRWFAGGSLAASHTASSVSTAVADPDVGPTGAVLNTVRVDGSAKSTFYSGSAVLARKLDSSGRTSLGLSVETLRGTGTLQSTSIDEDVPGSPLVDNVMSRSGVTQTRAAAGISREFAGSHKLGLLYRYGIVRANDDDTLHTINSRPAGLDSLRSNGHTSEISLRVRGPVSKRLLYGAQASWLGVSLHDRIDRAAYVESDQRNYGRRASISAGLGYVLKQRTLLSIDLAGGSSSTRATRFEDETGAVLQKGTSNNRFFSSHFAVQSGIWRRLFVTGSILLLGQSHRYTSELFPDRFGSTVPIDDGFLPLSPKIYQIAGRSSDFGAGWRFNPNVFVQYVFSTDYGFSPAGHTLMLRYTLRLRKR